MFWDSGDGVGVGGGDNEVSNERVPDHIGNYGLIWFLSIAPVFCITLERKKERKKERLTLWEEKKERLSGQTIKKYEQFENKRICLILIILTSKVLTILLVEL